VRSSRNVNSGFAAVVAGVLLAAAALSPAGAQVDSRRPPAELSPEPPPPPRILDEERAHGRASRGAPAPSISDTALAPKLSEPRPDASADLDEVLVVGTALRLPDLGSSLRAQREAERDEGRIAVSFLPLYDPEAARAGLDDPLFRNRELERVGFIDLFRIRFGKRSK
jgi:hypothetical protein